MWSPHTGWGTAGTSSRNYLCPPPYRSKAASVKCTYNKNYDEYAYKTVAFASIVYGGNTDSGSLGGDPLYLRCV
ncbi:hypothetical protein ACGFR6_36255 [Streptomyces sp. NPDC048567]|uniref:hypothetical protein n=1 Tax=Streptomyces sp. NPDC048567 TaxID=3365570 RepID=UPI003721D38E